MLFCLQAASLVNMGFFWNNCVRLHRHDYKSKQRELCAVVTLVEGRAYFLAIAVMLTINRWIYFNLRLNANIKRSKYEELLKPDRENIQVLVLQAKEIKLV